ncbi:hypothetical protein [Gimesia maris]|jgi:uncharacterized membrane protein YgcG|uniref:Uncharacterized protein n=1 Tax=Gimesia maris TaxID=122 RepID=A0A3D3R9H8_9PLAN|nr:hypothetical protein [Gimesia maris]MAC54735.1 hypothetical protein [Gimesia sp.]QDT78779.1 hypothetical protein Mal35_22290 [Gimesia maris]QDU14312.1 hypothetical protein CA11_21170 [Gimesia maris]HCO25493.1 hypothetical protein [Gimesia maris]|tara:strand:- start:106684 stop:107268 length:585 start_codon:yes stop_codon:yes gene_type:complete
MSIQPKIASLPAIALAAMLISGCQHKQHHAEIPYDSVAPLGTISDDIWQKQEENGEASDFVIVESEFVGATAKLNAAGEDHIKQIAVRMGSTPFPVVVEPSSMSVSASSEYKYPIHGNDDLDMHRRNVIVKMLQSMNVQDADERVVVAPAFTPGFEGFEAYRAYSNGFMNRGGGGGGFGGGFGGMGGGGGAGVF